MQQVTDWLDKLGMAEYAQRFAENRIDLSVLPHLTDQHLKELGVALGDRLKMLRAIRELGGAPEAAQAGPIIIPALTTAVAPPIAAHMSSDCASVAPRHSSIHGSDISMSPAIQPSRAAPAQTSRGKRDSLSTNYTFGVWDPKTGSPVPITKAYPGLTARDLARNSRIRNGFEKATMSDDEIQRWLAEI